MARQLTPLVVLVAVCAVASVSAIDASLHAKRRVRADSRSGGSTTPSPSSYPSKNHDPSPTWLSYAMASCPAGQRITSFTGSWLVPPKPLSHHAQENAFYCPWIGIETTDNRNLLQSVNGFFVGNYENNGEWHQNGESYQWSNSNNTNSEIKRTASGHTFEAGMVMNRDIRTDKWEQSYRITSQDTNFGAGTELNIAVAHRGWNDTEPGYKNYTIAYVVFEHGDNPCDFYPPTEQMYFTNLKVECDGILTPMNWTTSFVQDHCDFRAHVIDTNIIAMTWNTTKRK